MHILIVDDDEDVREVLGLVLRSRGHDVEEAADGLEGLARLRAGRLPALVLLDMMMPRLDGEGFMKAIRRDARLADTRVVVLSGHHAAREKAVELGAVGCLVKPVELEELVAAVEGSEAQREAPL